MLFWCIESREFIRLRVMAAGTCGVESARCCRVRPVLSWPSTGLAKIKLFSLSRYLRENSARVCALRVVPGQYSRLWAHPTQCTALLHATAPPRTYIYSSTTPAVLLLLIRAPSGIRLAMRLAAISARALP